MIDFLSIKLGFSLNILCPPVKECILCQRNLSINNRPTQVVVYKLTGPEIYSKYIYRCKSCSLVKTGWIFYKKSPQIFLRASNEVYFEKLLVKSYTNNLCHAWMSMEGQSEAYNQTWLNSDKTKIFL